MLKPFFAAAMLSPTRHRSFRWIAMVHVVCCAALSMGAIHYNSDTTMLSIGYLTLVLGIVEGSTLIGWRLTQLPKSLALEFLLTTPISSRGVFMAESLVGVARFSLIWLCGLPILGLMVFTGRVDWNEFVVLALMPYIWGLFTGLLLTVWTYEWTVIRRIGEVLAMLGVFVYLVVGVIAGENIVLWLSHLPQSIGKAGYHAVLFFHNMNPFGVVRYWFASDRADWLAWERFNMAQRCGCRHNRGSMVPRNGSPEGAFPRSTLQTDRLEACRPTESNRRSSAGMVGGSASDGILGSGELIPRGWLLVDLRGLHDCRRRLATVDGQDRLPNL